MAPTRTEDTFLRCDLAAGMHPGRCFWCGRARPGHRRKWCSDDCARAWADQHSWPAARMFALERAGWRCERCGRRPIRMEVHHVIEVDGYGPSCAHHATGLEALCPDCHAAEHSFRREVDRVLAWAEEGAPWADGQPQRQLVLPGVA